MCAVEPSGCNAGNTGQVLRACIGGMCEASMQYLRGTRTSLTATHSPEAVDVCNPVQVATCRSGARMFALDAPLSHVPVKDLLTTAFLSFLNINWRSKTLNTLPLTK